MPLIGNVYSNTQGNDRALWARSLAEAGYTLVDGDFITGATLTSGTDAVWDSTNAKCYAWGGVFPKEIPAKSVPTGDFVVLDLSDVLRQELAGGDGASLISVPGEGQTLHDWISGDVRSLFYYLLPDKIAAVISGEKTNITTELQAAMDDSITIWLPKGKYYSTSSIYSRRDSGLIGCGARHSEIDNLSSSHSFIIGDGGYSRGCKPWRDFSISASGDKTKDAYAFYYSDRQDTEGNPIYTVGQAYSGIEINSWGRLGGGWYLQECFRVSVRDCGGTGLSQSFRLVGSVVQSTIDNFINNGDGSVPITGRTYTYGLTTETKRYGNGTTFTPEGLVATATRFVRQDIGVSIAGGLLLTFNTVEADYSRYKGFEYRGGGQVSFNDCYVGVQSNRDADFFGFDIPATADGVAEAVNVIGCTVNMSVNTNASASSFKSYGARIGDSQVGSKGSLIDGCTFRGVGYDIGVYGYNARTATVNNNRFQFSGIHIQFDECPNLIMIGNTGNGTSGGDNGKYRLTSTSSLAVWTLLNNTETFELVSSANPSGILAMNRNYKANTTRRVDRVTSPVNVNVPAGGVYQHTISANTSLSASIGVGGQIPAGLVFSGVPISATGIRITFFNPTNSVITLTTTLFVDITYP